MFFDEFDQTAFGQFFLGRRGGVLLGWWVGWWAGRVVGGSGPEGVGRVGAWRGGGVGARREGAQREGGGPKFRAFLSLPPEISFFLPSLGGLLVEFLLVFVSCGTPAAPKPLGLAILLPKPFLLKPLVAVAQCGRL